MIQDNYTTLQNIKQHELYYSQLSLRKFKKNTHTNNNKIRGLIYNEHRTVSSSSNLQT